MSIDREPTSARPPRRHPVVAAIRTILLVPLPPNDTRLIDILMIVVGVPVALVICLPILALTLLAGIPIGFALGELGVPDTIIGIVGLGVFAAGLGLCFFVLLKLSKRLPNAVRAFAFQEDEPESGSAPVLRRDPNADDGTLHARLAAADAALAPGIAAADPGTSTTGDRPAD